MKSAFHLITCLVALAACGCAKKQAEVGRPVEFNPRAIVMRMKHERIQLLAIKYRLAPEKAEAAAWDYLKKHDVFARMLLEQVDRRDAKKTASLSKIQEDTSRGIAETVQELSTKYDFPEEAFAGFLADLKAADAAEK